MATIDQYVPFLLKWEGEFSDHPADRGGATNKGVTLKTWQQTGTDKNGDGIITVDDLKMISEHDLVEKVLRPHFWNRWQADRIRTQAIAELLVDWLWMSGPYSIKLAQKELGVEMDGQVGNRTLDAINSHSCQQNLFYRLKVARYAHFYRICDYRPANRVFLKGWLNRVRDMKFRLSIILVIAMLGTLACRPVAKLETSTHAAADSSATTSRHSSSREQGVTVVETELVTTLVAQLNAPERLIGDSSYAEAADRLILVAHSTLRTSKLRQLLSIDSTHTGASTTGVTTQLSKADVGMPVAMPGSGLVKSPKGMPKASNAKLLRAKWLVVMAMLIGLVVLIRLRYRRLK